MVNHATKGLPKTRISKKYDFHTLHWPPIVTVKDSGLTVLRCKTRCIGNGYSMNTIADCGWQATSIKLGFLVAVGEDGKQRAWLDLLTATPQHSRRNPYQLMRIFILHTASRRVWNSGHCLWALHELAHVCVMTPSI